MSQRFHCSPFGSVPFNGGKDPWRCDAVARNSHNPVRHSLLDIGNGCRSFDPFHRRGQRHTRAPCEVAPGRNQASSPISCVCRMEEVALNGRKLGAAKWGSVWSADCACGFRFFLLSRASSSRRYRGRIKRFGEGELVVVEIGLYVVVLVDGNYGLAVSWFFVGSVPGLHPAPLRNGDERYHSVYR